MGRLLVLGRGQHRGLFGLELEAVVAAHGGTVDGLGVPRLRGVAGVSPTAIREVALADRALVAAETAPLGLATSAPEALAAEVARWWADLDGTARPSGRFAVRCERFDGGAPEVHRLRLAGMIGGALAATGLEVSLDAPDWELEVWLVGVPADASGAARADAGLVCWGLTVPLGPEASAARQAPLRPFMKPVSLDPRLARVLVNLLRDRLEAGAAIADPLCGTGGLLIEAALVGVPAVGVDLDPEMVAGARRNVAWALEQATGDAGPPEVQVRRGDVLQLGAVLAGTWQAAAEPAPAPGARRAQEHRTGVSLEAATTPFEPPIGGVAFDPPYGRNSWHSEDSWHLWQAALRATAEVVPLGGRLACLLPAAGKAAPEDVLIDPLTHTGRAHGRPWADILAVLTDAGWRPDALTELHVHGSLRRLLLRCERVSQA